jgi:hypothetical protein
MARDPDDGKRPLLDLAMAQAFSRSRSLELSLTTMTEAEQEANPRSGGSHCDALVWEASRIEFHGCLEAAIARFSTQARSVAARIAWNAGIMPDASSSWSPESDSDTELHSPEWVSFILCSGDHPFPSKHDHHHGVLCSPLPWLFTFERKKRCPSINMRGFASLKHSCLLNVVTQSLS